MSDMVLEKLSNPHELGVYRYRNGIKLLNQSKLNNLISTQERPYSLSVLFDLPLSVYFLDDKSNLKNCNVENLKLLEADSLRSIYGKNVFDITKNMTCKKLIKNDKDVIYFKKTLFFDEQVPTKEGLFIDGISIKLPWFNEENKIIGIVGFSIVNGKHSLANSLSQIAKLGLFDQEYKLPVQLPGLQLGDIYLTKRETEILYYIVRGKSSRLIAEAITISERTVHSHVENIKNKMGVVNKAELIEKALEFIKLTPK